MKKYIILALALLTLAACSQFEELKGVSDVKPITTGVTVTANTVDASVPRPDSYIEETSVGLIRASETCVLGIVISRVVQWVKNPPAMQETLVRSLFHIMEKG